MNQVVGRGQALQVCPKYRLKPHGDRPPFASATPTLLNGLESMCVGGGGEGGGGEGG